MAKSNGTNSRLGYGAKRVTAVAFVAVALALLVFLASLGGARVASTSTSSLTTVSLGCGGRLSDIVEPCDIQGMTCPRGCSISVPWGADLYPAQKTLTDLVNASWYVFVGSVNATWTVAVGTVPLTIYNVSSTIILKTPTPAYPYIPEFGGYIQVGEVGGTAANSTMSLQGYPDLTVGGTYVFFLSPSFGASPDAPFADEINHNPNQALDEMTQGGPQGLFYVQGGDVYSLDNMYPQADSWIPTKVSGVPLSQFIQEIQADVTSTTAASP